MMLDTCIKRMPAACSFFKVSHGFGFNWNPQRQGGFWPKMGWVQKYFRPHFGSVGMARCERSCSCSTNLVVLKIKKLYIMEVISRKPPAYETSPGVAPVSIFACEGKHMRQTLQGRHTLQQRKDRGFAVDCTEIKVSVQ